MDENEILQLKTKLKNLESDFDDFQYRVNKKIGPGSNTIPTDNIPGARNYDAVVDINGKGDFKGIKEALDAGKKRIFVRNGTYVLTENIVITSDILLVGEDKYNTIIDCNNSYIITSAASIYSTGTITVTYNSNTVVGSGTVWSSNLSAGDYITIFGNPYIISSVVNDTTLTINNNYQNNTTSGLSYFAGDFNKNIEINNLTIQNYQPTSGNDGALSFNGVINSLFSNLIIKNGNRYSGNYGVIFSRTFNSIIRDCLFDNNGIYLLYLTRSENNIIINCKFANAPTNGVRLVYNGYNIIINCLFFAIRDNAISSTGASAASNVFISDCRFRGCSGCIDIDFGDNSSISNCEFYNSQYSITLGDNGVNYTKIINCKFFDFIGFAIDIGGNYNKVSNCIFRGSSESWDGITLRTSSYCSIIDNIFHNIGQDTNNTYNAIDIGDSALTATHHIISNNQVYSSSANKVKYGIAETSASADYNIITGNIVQGAVTTNISIQGANTIKVNNIE